MSLGQPSPPSPQTDIAQGLQLGTQSLNQINTPAAVESQAGSNYNQFDPYGSVTYSQTGTGPGGVPIYSSNTSLSPTQQGLLNTLQGTQRRFYGDQDIRRNTGVRFVLFREKLERLARIEQRKAG